MLDDEARVKSKRMMTLSALLLTVVSAASCLPDGDEPYTGDGPELQGTYELAKIQVYEGSCDSDPFPVDPQGHFKLQREASDEGDFLAWYDCSSPDTCDLTHKRNMSFYEPRPESWERVSLWAVEGVGECILRNETATAWLEGETLTIDVRGYRSTDRSIAPEECTQRRAATIATSANCARREVTTASLVTQ